MTEKDETKTENEHSQPSIKKDSWLKRAWNDYIPTSLNVALLLFLFGVALYYSKTHPHNFKQNQTEELAGNAMTHAMDRMTFLMADAEKSLSEMCNIADDIELASEVEHNQIKIKNLLSKLDPIETEKLISDIKKWSYISDFSILYNMHSSDYTIESWNQDILINAEKAWTYYIFKAKQVNPSRTNSLKLIFETGMTPRMDKWVGERIRLRIGKTELSSEEIRNSLTPVISGDITQNKWILSVLPNADQLVNGVVTVEVWYGTKEKPLEQNTNYSLWSELTSVFYEKGIDRMDTNLRIAGKVGEFRKYCVKLDQNNKRWEILDVLCGNADFSVVKPKESDVWNKLTGYDPPPSETVISIAMNKGTAISGVPMILFTKSNSEKVEADISYEKSASKQGTPAKK